MDIDFAFRPNEGLPFSAHKKMRDAGPVAWSEKLDGWLVSSYDGVRTVLGDLTRFTSKGTPVADTLAREAMLTNETPLHHTMRAVWETRVSKAAIAARAMEIEDIAAGLLEEARPRLAAGEAVDFMPIIREFIIAYIGRGFEIPAERLEIFRRWNREAVGTPALEVADSAVRARHDAIKQEVQDMVRAEVEDRLQRFASGESPVDLISLMVAAEGREGITRSMVIDNVFSFVLGSLETTERWIGNVVARLAADPELRAAVKADRSLIEALSDESMRVDTVAQVIMRRVRAGGAELGGQRLNGGDQVFVMLGAANADPAQFEHPDSFDLNRTRRLNLGFGFGMHHCLGINIARREAIAFANVLLNKFPDYRVADCDYGNTWALWGPRRLDVACAPASKT